MGKEVPKKTSIILLFIAIFLAIIFTFGILNYFQTPKTVEDEVKESASSGEVSLTIEKPPKFKDDSTGDVSLTILPSGDKK